MISIIIYANEYPHRFTPRICPSFTRIETKQQHSLSDSSVSGCCCINPSGVFHLVRWLCERVPHHVCAPTCMEAHVLFTVNGFLCIYVQVKHIWADRMYVSCQCMCVCVCVCYVHVSICTSEIRVWCCSRIKALETKVDAYRGAEETSRNITWGWMSEKLNTVLCSFH